MASRFLEVLTRVAFAIGCATLALFTVLFTLTAAFVLRRCGLENAEYAAFLFGLFVFPLPLGAMSIAAVYGYRFRSKVLVVVLALAIISFGAIIVEQIIPHDDYPQRYECRLDL